MPHLLVMPRQGNTVESCIITGFKVKEGDEVSADTIVCEVETDKAAFEVPAGLPGTVLKLLYKPGDDVPVLKPIAVIGSPGENWQDALSFETLSGGTDAPQKNSAAKSTLAFTSMPDPQVSGLNTGLQVSSMEAEPLRPSGKASPRARKLAEKEALPLPASGSGPGARIIERDVSAALLSMSRLTAAAKASLKAPGLSGGGSGIGGRLTLEDMLKGADLAAPMGQPAVIEGGYTDTPLKSVRKIIADRMSASLAESAQLTLNTSAGASKLKEIRSRYKETTGEEAQITINDLVLFAVSRTLKSFPYMNAHKYGDTIRIFQRVHLGIAVDTPRGLMVPVVRNASQLSLKEISSEAKQLALSCQENKINPDDLSGSTFTVSNLGNLGITSFTPILNVPEVAILGVCAMEIKPVFNEKQDKVSNNAKQVSYEPFIGFSLTINHQAVDGAPAARFLQGLVEAIENIDTFLF